MITAAAVGPILPAVSLATTGSHEAGLVALVVVAATSMLVAVVGVPDW